MLTVRKLAFLLFYVYVFLVVLVGVINGFNEDNLLFFINGVKDDKRKFFHWLTSELLEEKPKIFGF